MERIEFLIGDYENEIILILSVADELISVREVSIEEGEGDLYSGIVKLEKGEDRLIPNIPMDVAIRLMGRDVPVMTVDSESTSIVNVNIVQIEMAA